MNFFDAKYTNLHKDKKQVERQRRAVDLNEMDYVDFQNQIGKVDGRSVSLEKCNCLDFHKRGKPCKHMYRLAMDLGIFSIEDGAKKFNQKIEVLFRRRQNGVFEKIFNVDEGFFTVRFREDKRGVKAHCSCRAGKYKMLCRHIIQCITEDEEIAELLSDYGLLTIYEEHLNKIKESEKLEREAKNLKRNFARLLLE
ncbi:MAG: SWIM zinc finger family protein [Selenomonadaceae bacterium]|nr:SWIM zinc finger family protein [Selenomonadaceae bacterium]